MNYTDYRAAMEAAYNSLAHAKLYMQTSEHRLAFAGIQDALAELRQAMDLASDDAVLMAVAAKLDADLEAACEEL